MPMAFMLVLMKNSAKKYCKNMDGASSFIIITQNNQTQSTHIEDKKKGNDSQTYNQRNNHVLDLNEEFDENDDDIYDLVYKCYQNKGGMKECFVDYFNFVDIMDTVTTALSCNICSFKCILRNFRKRDTFVMMIVEDLNYIHILKMKNQLGTSRNHVDRGGAGVGRVIIYLVSTWEEGDFFCTVLDRQVCFVRPRKLRTKISESFV